MMSTATAIQPPRTMMELFESLPEGTPAQLIENNIVMSSPAPLDIHQKVLVEIHFQLLSLVKKKHLGETRVAPYDVYLGRKNVFQPDILFISNERLHLIEKNGLHGAPDLVIEILSPGTAKYDLEEKKDVYERFGVKEYWIVEPASRSVEGYFLINDYFEKILAKDGEISSRLLNKTFSF
jgi:Uma2 family endonuclease